ncbi:hypothetical protein HanRHA438_Chr08g0349441 [Helianthus annuus]|nr:hypothetical protein HanRHA438_Chr08g0349441 [Helianthus annuus]
MKLVNHPKYRQTENAVPQRLDFEWKTVGNTVDCGVFVVHHMETWFGVQLINGVVASHLSRAPRK